MQLFMDVYGTLYSLGCRFCRLTILMNTAWQGERATSPGSYSPLADSLRITSPPILGPPGIKHGFPLRPLLFPLPPPQPLRHGFHPDKKAVQQRGNTLLIPLHTPLPRPTPAHPQPFLPPSPPQSGILSSPSERGLGPRLTRRFCRRFPHGNILR